MTAAAVLAEAEAAGLAFKIGADRRLRISGEAPLEILGRLWEHRHEIVALLLARAEAVPKRDR